MHPRILLIFLATKTCCWLTDSLLSSRTSRSPLSRAAFQQISPQPVVMHRVALPQVQDPAFVFCWTSSCSVLPNAPARPDLANWQHSLLVCQPLFPVLYHQQMCWGNTLSLHPGHWWINLTGLDPGLTRGEHCWLTTLITLCPELCHLASSQSTSAAAVGCILSCILHKPSQLSNKSTQHSHASSCQLGFS